jgi:DNA-directed RNA polymerase specialized sigma24 family protein
MVPTFAVLTARHRFLRMPAAAPSLAAGDAQIEAAMALHLPFVWRVLRRFGLSRLEAEEAAREVFAAFAARRGSARRHAQVEVLARSTVLVAQARRRLRGPWALVPANDVVPCETEDSLLCESLVLIDGALDQLDPTDRAIFVFTELEGLKCARVASVLGLPPALVAFRRRRARTRFTVAATRVVRDLMRARPFDAQRNCSY